MFAALALAASLATPSCPPGDAARTATLPLAIQNKLLAHKIAPDDFELDAPAEVGNDIVMLRKTLDVATQAFFRCEAGDESNPASLQKKLAAFLHTDYSKRDDNNSSQDGIYGANLRVRVEDAKKMPNSIFVVLTFGIDCGNDNLLLLYTKDSGRWHQRLHWYSDKYTKPSDAFGDIFFYNWVPGTYSSQPLLAVAHGQPWCTSVHSGFSLDLIQLTTTSSPQNVLDHITHRYVRDGDPAMNATADGLQLHLVVESNDDSVIYHPGILRYRTTSGKFELLPVALNARDFTDEWLQEPWSTVEHWSASANLERLHQSHNKFDYSIHKDGTDIPTLTFGPVRACTSSPNHFQIELDLSQGSTQMESPLYALIQQNPNSFTMLDTTSKPDSTCNGPDLMKKRK
jgi:hypothetical protein